LSDSDSGADVTTDHRVRKRCVRTSFKFSTISPNFAGGASR
jgi:hypothetical protein